MENKRILVVGGTGYVGKPLVERFKKKGYQVTVLSRRSKGNGAAEIKGSILDEKFLLQRLKGFSVVVYLAAVVRSLNKARYQENCLGLQNTLAAMLANKVRKILFFSTQNVHLKETGPYGTSKKQSEEILRKSSVDYMIIRPNYVYGIDRHNDLYQLHRIMRLTKLCPTIGDGKTKIQPVNKENLATITITCMENWESQQAIEVSGNRTLSVNQIVDIIKKQAGLGCLQIHAPMSVMKLFQWMIPFDLDGYSEDRIAPNTAKVIKGTADLEEDLKKMVHL